MNLVNKVAIDPRDEMSNATLFVIGLVAVTIFMVGAGWLAPKILK